MKLKFIIVGKNTEQWVESYMKEYIKRVNLYTTLNVIYVKESKNTDNSILQLKAESVSVLKELKKDDFVVLMDEQGVEFTSFGFANQIQQWQNSGKKTVTFIIGGAYGFDITVQDRANMKMALSKLTFTHQMARVFLAEQVYRSFTIIHKLPYHH